MNWFRKMEPLGRIELPTFPLPMGCYTPKPQWRCSRERSVPFGCCDGMSYRWTQDWNWVRVVQPRSHSLVLRMTGNHVGSSLRSSNLRLGAIITDRLLLKSSRGLCHLSIGHGHGGGGRGNRRPGRGSSRSPKIVRL